MYIKLESAEEGGDVYFTVLKCFKTFPRKIFALNTFSIERECLEINFSRRGRIQRNNNSKSNDKILVKITFGAFIDK